MYVLVNEFGNVYKEVNTKQEKEQLLKQGYKEVKEEKKDNKKITSKGANEK
jgi:hypothetical protein